MSRVMVAPAEAGALDDELAAAVAGVAGLGDAVDGNRVGGGAELAFVGDHHGAAVDDGVAGVGVGVVGEEEGAVAGFGEAAVPARMELMVAVGAEAVVVDGDEGGEGAGGGAEGEGFAAVGTME